MVLPYRRAALVNHSEPYRRRRADRRRLSPTGRPAPMVMPESTPLVIGLAFATPLALGLWAAVAGVVAIVT